jgi:DNA-binding LytR/AlgR family response regulator
VEEVGWFCAQLKMTAVATRDGRSYFLDQPLEAVEADLDPQRFFRISRQFVVAASAIERIEKLEGGRLALRLKPPPPDGVFVAVSRARVAEFRAWLDR